MSGPEVYLNTINDGSIFLGYASDKYSAANLIRANIGKYGCNNWNYSFDDNTHNGNCLASRGGKKSRKSRKSKKSRKSRKSRK